MLFAARKMHKIAVFDTIVEMENTGTINGKQFG